MKADELVKLYQSEQETHGKTSAMMLIIGTLIKEVAVIAQKRAGKNTPTAKNVAGVLLEQDRKWKAFVDRAFTEHADVVYPLFRGCLGDEMPAAKDLMQKMGHAGW